MKHSLFPKLLTPVAALCIALPGSSHAEVTVEPAGLQIVWKPLKEEFDGFKTFNSSKAVQVSLAARAGDKGIISFNKDESEVTISDGTNELEGKFGPFNKISKDTKTMRVEVVSEKLPGADATKLTVTGKLDLTVASKTKTKASKPSALKKGDKIELGEDFTFEVSDIGKPKWGKDPLAVTLKWKRKVPELAAVRFFDAEGKEIESSRGGSSSMGFRGKYTVSKSYNLKKKSDVLKIEMDLWVDLEKVTVPLNIAVGIGGAK